MTGVLAEGLARFFDAMHGGLTGALSPADIETRLGARSSSATRLELVFRMVAAAREQLVARAHPATRAACDDATWRAAVTAHLAGEAGAEPDFPRIALGFVFALERAGAPSDVVELADFEEVLHRLSVVGAPEVRGTLRCPVIVRQYTFDVPARVMAHRGDARRAAEPSAPSAPVFVLAYRDPETARARFLTPSVAELAALAVAMGDAREEDVLSSHLSRPALAEASHALAAHGIVRSPAVPPTKVVQAR